MNLYVKYVMRIKEFPLERGKKDLVFIGHAVFEKRGSMEAKAQSKRGRR
jgi:hypothetical protein